MKYFTMEDTEGFSQAQLDEMNEKFDQRMATDELIWLPEYEREAEIARLICLEY